MNPSGLPAALQVPLSALGHAHQREPVQASGWGTDHPGRCDFNKQREGLQLCHSLCSHPLLSPALSSTCAPRGHPAVF